MTSTDSNRDNSIYQQLIAPSAKGVPLPSARPTLDDDKHGLVNVCDEERTVKPTAEAKGICHQILSTCAILVLTAACGMPIGYSAVLLPQLSLSSQDLANNTAELVIDIEMSSWIASIHSLAMPIGSFLSGPLADYLGRRTALLVSVLPVFLGWSTLALAQSYPVLLTGRFLCGFATGILGGPAQVYIAETAEANLRGILIGAPFVSYSLGILIVYALGSSLHWRTVAWCGNILPSLAALALFLVPETPVWLVRHQNYQRAFEALQFLRGNDILAKRELNEMRHRFEREAITAADQNLETENIIRLCCRPEAFKPLVIVIVFSLLQMLSGTYIVVFYAVDIIGEFGADIDLRTAAIWTALVRMICTIVFCIIILLIRRRTILLVAGFGSALSCLVLSGYLHFTQDELKRSSMDVMVASVCLLIYIVFNTANMVMPGVMTGELFPARIRGRTAGIVFAVTNIALFLMAKVFPLVSLSIRMKGVFLVFASASLVMALFVFMFQPETKGRTLDEIEDYFRGGHWFWFKGNQRKSNRTISTATTATTSVTNSTI